MKLPALALLLLAPFALAQEKPGTPRKTMTFQPGEKAPGGVLPASSEPITPTASVENGPVPLVKASSRSFRPARSTRLMRS